MKKIAVISQCRLGSKRLTSKILLKINNEYLINLFTKRLKKINCEKIILAIANEKNKNKLIKKINKNKVEIFVGSQKNLLKRYYDCAKFYKLDIIIRITSDCPLIDPYLVNKGIKLFKKKKIDYLSNNLPRSWPHGLDYEVFTFETLKKTYFSTKKKYNLEHVTPYMRKSNQFEKINLKNKRKLDYIRWTLDYMNDYDYIKFLHKKFKYLKKDYRWERLYKDCLRFNYFINNNF